MRDSFARLEKKISRSSPESSYHLDLLRQRREFIERIEELEDLIAADESG